MPFDSKTIYELLPSWYRMRDADAGNSMVTPEVLLRIQELQQQLNAIHDQNSPEAADLQERIDEQRRGPLKALLAIVAEQVAVLEENLAQLYDDQFIETCAEWVVPYIGDLVGTSGIFTFPGAPFSQRSQVADTMMYRRRKGTAAVIEQLARDVTGWNASVVEYFQVLAATQYMNHLRPGNLSVANLRDATAMEYVNTPFDRIPHTADVRNIERKRGKYNIPNVGIHLWRIGNYQLTQSPAFEAGTGMFTFDALGRNVRLYNKPEVEATITHLAAPVNVSMPLSRWALDNNLEGYYGDEEDKSIFITINNKKLEAGVGQQLHDIISICDLSDITDSWGNVTGWNHVPAQHKVSIDPVLGRIALPNEWLPETSQPMDVRVTYQYGFSASMGGGEYLHADTTTWEDQPAVFKVPDDVPTIQKALDKLVNTGGIVEIAHTDCLHETPVIHVPEGKTIEIRSGEGARGVLVLQDELVITGGVNSVFVLNGLLVSGGAVRVPATDKTGSANGLHELDIQHCTLLPVSDTPSLWIDLPDTTLKIDDSITGAIRASEDATVYLSNSIADAGSETGVAFAAAAPLQPGAVLHAENSTVIGKVYTRIMQLASNSIFVAATLPADGWQAPVIAARLQQGCIRFSYIPPGSKLPSAYQCQPVAGSDTDSIKPSFTSLQYGEAGYCQLALQCPCVIKTGASDGAEMGAFHNLYQPQREANLRKRLNEYLPFGLEAGIFYGS
ncbi:hypothetical protein [Deminuibacter soli]|uniref:Uncharacterized protein n=1 Tax=Deminuibacter soli TaxID=2291815 RepID=A0A3E1NGJ0_9BACT|nr:hypothetical protein [Deminuibacter soli]RFM26944.1 hypothetical protein DXN05_18340 [Deminuibacter soli]